MILTIVLTLAAILLGLYVLSVVFALVGALIIRKHVVSQMRSLDNFNRRNRRF